MIGNRRKFLQAAGILGAGLLSGANTSCTSPKFSQKFIDHNLIADNKFRKFPKLNISSDRVVKETVGLRPFRKNGFRVEQERIGDKIIIHNYGHGGSGFSLSWGTADLAAELAQHTGETRFAVLGSGVVGLTTARLLQSKGYAVSIYTKALPPDVTSSKATGTWSPSYTLIEPELITTEFEGRWKRAAGFSFRTYQNLLGMNDVVTWLDEYLLANSGSAKERFQNREGRLHLPGLLPEVQILERKDHPFEAAMVMKQTTLVFNIPSYLNKLINDFLEYGGRVNIKDFKSQDEIQLLEERCIMNCTGLGSLSLFNDTNMMPVAGQLSFLIPQPDFNYRLTTEDGYAIPRKDGVVLGGNALKGSWDENPDSRQTQKVVNALINVMNSMRA
jgi:hypothetical protein